MQYNRVMTNYVRSKSGVSALLIIASLGIGAIPVLADSTEVSPSSPTAALGVRLQYDSSGCPIAAELLLERTADTIRGLEAVLQWDRPNAIQFVRATALPDSIPTADSLAGLLAPKDRSSLLPLETRGHLLGHWEFAQARWVSGTRAKIIAVAQILSDSEKVAIVPGQSGVLCRLPIRVIPREDSVSAADSLVLNLDPMETHLATSRGDLARLAQPQPAVARFDRCVTRRPHGGN